MIERANVQTIEYCLADDDTLALQRVCGTLEEHLRLLEKNMGVRIVRKVSNFTITGHAPSLVVKVLEQLLDLARQRELTKEDIHLASVGVLAGTEFEEEKPQDSGVVLKLGGKRELRGRTPRQSQYIKAMQKYDITFGIGPAGTGKTYLAVAAAVAAMDSLQVERIVLTRPAVEAGEKLGFLPGDLSQKVDPYLRPLYDALYDFMGFDKVCRCIERGLIEIAPLAYMRGRTLGNAFVILDEAQNTTTEQMKMFLTRIGIGSKAVITGDISQVDLPRHIESGLKNAINILDGVDGVCFHYFKSNDIVRHPLVQKIVDAYDLYNQNNKE